jgi:hypothetical protein
MVEDKSKGLQIKHVSDYRTFANIQYSLGKGSVAFFLGAGIDIFLERESIGYSQDVWEWSQLVYLLNFLDDNQDKYNERIKYLTSGNWKESEWKKAIDSWPTEFATYPRWKFGEERFLDTIKKYIDRSDFKPNCYKPVTKSFRKLLSYSNLLVTTNYSSRLIKTMKTLKKNIKYIVLDREDLSSFIIPEPSKKKDISTVYIVFLHGRPSKKSFPILDAWGYNIAQFDNNDYLEFLAALFKNRDIVTIGTRWTDIPMRNITNSLNRKYPYLNRTYLNLNFVSDGINTPEKLDVDEIHAHLMNAIYGIHSFNYDKNTQPSCFQKISSSLKIPNTNIKSLEVPLDKERLSSIAEFFDSTGDFESPLQHQFLIELGKNIQAKNVDPITYAKNGVQIVFVGINKLDITNYENWELAIRIERHLRHHLYLYPIESNNKQIEPRKALWEYLFQMGSENEFIKQLLCQNDPISQRRAFDFLLGRHELRVGNNDVTYEFNNDIFNRRWKLSNWVWVPYPSIDTVTVKCLEGRDRLAIKLLDSGWESIAAKVLTDKLCLMAKLLNSTNNEKCDLGLTYSDIISEASRAESIAKVSGCFRRRVKADVINAFWNKNPNGTRNRLLAQLKSGYYGGTYHMELGLIQAIGMGLVVNQLRFEGNSRISNTDTCDLVNKILDEAGLEKNMVLTKKNYDYWEEMVPNELIDKYKIIAPVD